MVSSPVSSHRVRDKSLSGLQRDTGSSSLSPQRIERAISQSLVGNERSASPANGPYSPLTRSDGRSGRQADSVFSSPHHSRSISLDSDASCTSAPSTIIFNSNTSPTGEPESCSIVLPPPNPTIDVTSAVQETTSNPEPSHDSKLAPTLELLDCPSGKVWFRFFFQLYYSIINTFTRGITIKLS